MDFILNDGLLVSLFFFVLMLVVTLALGRK